MAEQDLSKVSMEELLAIAGEAAPKPQQSTQVVQPGAPQHSVSVSRPKTFWQENPKITSAVYGLREPIDAMAQMAPRSLAAAFKVAGLPSVANFLQQEAADVDKTNSIVETTYKDARGGDESFDWAKLAGNITSPANLIPGALAVKGARALTAAAPAAVQRLAPMMAAGMAGGANAPVRPTEQPPTDVQPGGAPMSQADFLQQKIGQVGTGALGGVILGVFGDRIGKFLMPKLSDSLAKLKQAGVDINSLSIGQALGGLYKKTEDFIRDVIPGGAIERAQERGVNAFSAGLVRRVIEDLNGTAPGAKINIPKDASTQDLMGLAQQAITERYTTALQTIKSVEPTAPGIQLIKASGQYADQNLTGVERDIYLKWLQKISGAFAPKAGGAPSIPAQQFKKFDEDLGNDAHNYIFGKGSTSEQRDLGKALQMAQNALREMAAAKDPTGLLKQANAAHAALQVPQRAATSLEAAKNREGGFTPDQLLNASRRGATDKQFARGDARYQDIAQAGSEVLGGSRSSPIENFGKRAAAYTALGGVGHGAAESIPGAAGTALGIGLAGMLGTNAAYSPAMQQLLVRSLVNRPQAINRALGPVAGALQAGVQRATPGAAPAVGGLPVQAAERFMGQQ